MQNPENERHQVNDDRDYNGGGLTFCGLDPDPLPVVNDDPLDLSDDVTCEACLAAIEEYEAEQETEHAANL